LRRICLLLVVSPIITFLGCAGTPRWTKGVPEGLSHYYFQGIGYARTRKGADQSASIALMAEKEGAEVEAVSEDKMRYVQTKEGERYVEVFTDKGVVTVRGTVPPGVRIVERWYNRSTGEHWSYALLAKPDAELRIRMAMRRRLRFVTFKSLFPGWAQFTKGQDGKGWRVLALEGFSLAGAAVFNALSIDAVTKRDRATVQSDIDYYDAWANRFYWTSVGFGIVAGGVYLYNLIDGLASEPRPYQVLSYGGTGHPVYLSLQGGQIALNLRFDALP